MGNYTLLKNYIYTYVVIIKKLLVVKCLISFQNKNKILKKIYFREFKSYRDASNFCNKINKNNYENDFLNEYRLKSFT